MPYETKHYNMKNSEQPAHPAPYENQDGTIQHGVYTGLTKREEFAKAAMAAIIPSYMSKSISLEEIDIPCKLAAQWSLKFADELLKQLES